MNGIQNRQMMPDMLRLLRDRGDIYGSAKRCVAIGLSFTLMLPLVGLGLSSIWPWLKPYIAFAALAFSVFEVSVIDPWLKQRLRLAAKLGEQFDCEVLTIKWNKFLVGERIDPEPLGAGGALSESELSRLSGWYPSDVERLPLHLGRVVCQRNNVWYDSTLRKRYRFVLLTVALAVSVVVGVASLAIDPSMTDFVLTVLVPLTPGWVWMLRERNRHATTCELLDRLNVGVKNLLDDIGNGVSEQDMSVWSRDLQDAIYNHRVSSPLIFDWIYRALRPRMELQMKEGTAQLVQRLLALSPSS